MHNIQSLAFLSLFVLLSLAQVPPNPASVGTSVGNYVYTGCFADSPGHNYILPVFVDGSGKNTVEWCINQCASQNRFYAAVEDTSQCFCGKVVNSYNYLVADSNCNMTCSSNTTERCGGNGYSDLYYNQQLANALSSSSVASSRSSWSSVLAASRSSAAASRSSASSVASVSRLSVSSVKSVATAAASVSKASASSQHSVNSASVLSASIARASSLSAAHASRSSATSAKSASLFSASASRVSSLSVRSSLSSARSSSRIAHSSSSVARVSSHSAATASVSSRRSSVSNSKSLASASRSSARASISSLSASRVSFISAESSSHAAASSSRSAARASASSANASKSSVRSAASSSRSSARATHTARVNVEPYRYAGCYPYAAASPALSLHPSIGQARNSLEICANACFNHTNFGVSQNQCYCDNSISGTAVAAADASCFSAAVVCPGNSGEVCGTANYMPVYAQVAVSGACAQASVWSTVSCSTISAHRSGATLGSAKVKRDPDGIEAFMEKEVLVEEVWLA